MDIDFMKSDAENQMEMMLMQMDKLPDFCSAYSDHNTNNIPMLEFLQTHQNHFNSISTDSNNNDTLFDEHSSPPFMNNNHTISFDPSSFMQGSSQSSSAQKRNSMAAMREMIFRIAAMQPIHIDPETVKPPKRRNVKISTDPQSVAARHRREKISERIRILQRLVPGGTKMDTASMLDEAIHYVKFLKNQVQSLERVAGNRPAGAVGVGFPVPSGSYYPVSGKGYHHQGDD